MAIMARFQMIVMIPRNVQDTNEEPDAKTTNGGSLEEQFPSRLRMDPEPFKERAP